MISGFFFISMMSRWREQGCGRPRWRKTSGPLMCCRTRRRRALACSAACRAAACPSASARPLASFSAFFLGGLFHDTSASLGLLCWLQLLMSFGFSVAGSAVSLSFSQLVELLLEEEIILFLLFFYSWRDPMPIVLCFILGVTHHACCVFIVFFCGS